MVISLPYAPYDRKIGTFGLLVPVGNEMTLAEAIQEFTEKEE
jgi:hypothetical protein